MGVFLTRLVATVALAAVAPLGVAACSGGTEDSTLQRSQTPTRAPTSSKGTKSPGGTTPTTPPASPAPAPAPTPPAGSAPPPASPAPAPTPPAPGSCGAPKCFGLLGVAGCKATDGAGDLVTMGCEDGACACLTAGQTTTTFDGDVNSAEDARQLFLTNCTCN